MLGKNTTSICGYQSEDCVSEAYGEMIVEDLTRKFSGLGKSLCDCKPLCTDLRYNVETSQSVFIGKEFYKNREKDNFDFTK
jgi:amiloride-sensitive sodium channel